MSDSEKKQTKSITLWAVFAVLLFLAEVFGLPHSHDAHAGWQKIKGVYLLIGFFGGGGLMLAAKALGKIWLYRKEDDRD